MCDTKAGKCVECNTSNDCANTHFCGVGKICRPRICKGPGCNGLQFFLCRADGSGYDLGASCDDGNPCTDNACDANSGCSSPANAAPCDDLNACTSKDTCANKVCSGAAVECNDFNPCTKDTCSAGWGCQNLATSDSCNDGNACTQIDVCSGGSCKGSNQLNCNDNNPCTTDSCDPKSGCKALPNTANCDDGDSCTEGEVCVNGVCKGKTSPCFAASCNAGLCSYAQICCTSNSECSDNDALCTTDACVNGKCVFTPTQAQGCCTPKFHEETFETSTAAGWTFQNSAGVGKGWQVWTSASVPFAGKGALYYGDPVTGTYELGGANSGIATFKTTLPAAKTLTLKMSIRMDTEAGNSYDNLIISKVVGGIKSTVWTKSDEVAGKYAVVTIDLSADAGKAIEIQLAFATGDAVANGTLGVHVDDFTITGSCP